MISIIIPVYNTELYIKQCIESVLFQTYSDWELILVDDGSTDQSGIICDEFASLDKRIKCVHQINGGVTAARKRGWELSNGEWITFVDSDDTLPNNALATLYYKTENSDTDIIEGYSYFRCHLPQVYDINNYRQCLLKSVDVVSVAIWGKLFRKAIVDSWCFDIPREILRGEDWIMNIRISFLSTKTPLFIQDKIYNYREDNLSSLSHIHSKNVYSEYMFFQSFKDSIPIENDDYSNYVVRIGIMMFVGVCVSNVHNVDVVDSPFAHEIKQLVKKYTYIPHFHQSVLLYSRNKWLRKLVWKAHCYKDKFLNFTSIFVKNQLYNK